MACGILAHAEPVADGNNINRVNTYRLFSSHRCGRASYRIDQTVGLLPLVRNATFTRVGHE